MNSIALLLWMIATSGQVTGLPGGPSLPGATAFKYGWKPDDKGRGLCYIVHVTPEASAAIASGRDELAVDIPDFLQGRVSQVMWRTGLADVERDPSQAELQANPRAYLPSSAQNIRAPGSLANLNDNGGRTVNLDPPVRSNLAFPVNVGRETDNDPTMPSVPSLNSVVQNSPNSRNGFGIPDSSGTFPPTGAGLNSPTLPRTAPTYPSNSLMGPPMPTNYGNTPLTTSGTPSTFSTPNPYSTPNNANPFGSNTNSSYGAGTNSAFGPNANNLYGPTPNPVTVNASPNGTNAYANGYGQGNGITNGNFGGGNGYQPIGTGSTFPSSGNSVYPPNSQNVYSPQSSSPYANPNLYTNTQLNGSNPAYPPFQNTRPDYLVAQNTPMNSATNPNNTGSPMSPAFGSQPFPSNQNLNPPTQFLANNPNPMAVRTNSMDPNRLSENYSNRFSQPYETVSAPNYFATLFLLVSLVGNAYMFWLLSKLMQRYRNLQANSRGVSSLSM